MSASKHEEQLLAEIDQRLQANGVAGGLTPALRSAFLACPRHTFLRRFRLFADEPVRCAHDEADMEAQAGAIYLDDVLIHVDEEGRDLPSTNSKPSFVARLLTILDLQPGHRVLEIGSGSGWLAALAGHLVGPSGYVVGVEIIEALALESRCSLIEVGAQNVEIVVGDGALGHLAGAPYDRIVVTAGTWDVPAAWFGQLSKGGLLLVPLRIKGIGEDVVLLRRLEEALVAEAALFAYFVPLAGSRAGGGEVVRLDVLPFWAEISNRICFCTPAEFGGSFAETFGFRTSAFRSFLTKTEPRFAMLNCSTAESFAIIDDVSRSVAVCEPHQIVGFGGRKAADALIAAYRRWADLLMPTVSAFDLTVLPAGAVVPPDHGWIEQRGDSVLIWNLKLAAAASDLTGGSPAITDP